MALPLVIPNCVEVRLLWILNAQLGVNVLHGNVTGSVTVNLALANAIGSAVKSAYTANLAGLQTVNVALARIGVRDLRSAHLPEFLDTGALVSGSGTGDSLPNQNAACITLRTGLSGKSFRGRVFISGFNELQNDSGGLTVAAANAASVSFLTAVSNALTANGLALSVASRPAERKTLVETTFHNDGTTTTRTLSQQTAKSGTSTAVTSIAARDANWQSQRRRANGRGVPPTLFAVAEHVL